MINVFRMEWFRMWRSFSTWVIFVVYIGLFAFAGGLMGILVGDSELSQNFQRELFGASLTTETEYAMEENAGVTLELEGEAAMTDSGAITDFAELFNACMMGNMVVLFTSVFIGMHATAHTVTGFQKNLAGATKKWHFVVSNFLICLVLNAILILLGMAVLRVIMLITHDTVTLSSMSDLLRYSGTYLLLTTTYGMLAALVADVTRNRIAAITVPVVYCTMGNTLMYQLINYIADGVLGFEGFQIEEYAPYGRIVNMTITDSAESFVKAVVSAVVVTVICMTASILVKRKQDVK